MTREEIIKLARDATNNEPIYCRQEFTFSQKQLERFAALVAAAARAEEREACYALRQTLPNPHEHCQVSAHAYDMAIAAYGAAIRARNDT